MNAQVAAFKAQVDPILTQLGADLDNIAADEASLAAEITALKAQIAAGGGTLDAESQAALDSIVATAQARAARSASIAAAVPDTVTPAP